MSNEIHRLLYLWGLYVGHANGPPWDLQPPRSSPSPSPGVTAPILAREATPRANKNPER